MRRTLLILITLTVSFSLTGPLRIGQTRQKEKPFRAPTDLIVKFKAGSQANIAARFNQLGDSIGQSASEIQPLVATSMVQTSSARADNRVGSIIQQRGLDRIFVLKPHPGADLETELKNLRSRSDVEYAEPNWKIELGGIPDDPDFWKQWSLRNLGFGVGQLPSTANADIKAYAAWDITPGSGNVVVAVTDTGFDATHPDMAGSLYINAGEIPGNGIDDDRNGYIDDVSGFNVAENNGDISDLLGHGTEMAGIIAARANNSVGIAGVSQSKIMPVKFFKRTGPDPDQFDATIGDAARALIYSVAAGARIINASWRTLMTPGDVTPAESQALSDAVAATDDAGALLVCIAGNEGFNLDFSRIFPASYLLQNQIVVAATDFNDEMWHPINLPFFLNTGFGKNTVHLTAPGVSVLTVLARGDCLGCSQSDNPDDWYIFADGTSISAAMVSGVAALVKSQFPNDSAVMIKQRILKGVQRIQTLESFVITGGRLDAAGALAVTLNIVQPVLTSARYKKSTEKLILRGSNIQRGVRVFVAGKGYDAKPKRPDLSEFKLTVPISELPSGVAVTIRLRNPDGGESGSLSFTR
jgi:subtilisin family serine protease